MRQAAANQRGAALVSAIFLLVVLAALGAYMVTVSGVQQTTVNRALINARTHYAVRAGLEWGVHQVVSPSGFTTPCPATATFSPAGFGFDGISVTVACTSNLYIPGVDTTVYTLTSTATHGAAGTAEHAERRLEAIVCRADESATNRCGDNSAP